VDKWSNQARLAVLEQARKGADGKQLRPTSTHADKLTALTRTYAHLTGYTKAAYELMAEDLVMGPKVEAHNMRHGVPKSQHQMTQFLNRMVSGKDGFTGADNMRMLKWGMPPAIYESDRVAGSVKREREPATEGESGATPPPALLEETQEEAAAAPAEA